MVGTPMDVPTITSIQTDPNPENAWLISAYTQCANSIKGSGNYMPKDIKSALRINIISDRRQEQFELTCRRI